MRHGIELTGAKAACIAFYDQETRPFQGMGDARAVRALREKHVLPARRPGRRDLYHPAYAYVLSNDRPGTKHQLSKLARDEGIRSFICLPLTSHASRLGVIYFYRADRDTFLPDEIDLLQTFAHLAAGAIENARLYDRSPGGAHRRAHRALPIGASSTRAWRRSSAAPSATASPTRFMMLDIDHFKQVNDTYGHAAGDAVLQALAGILTKQFREVDTVARYGGEEFAVILPEISGGTAKPVAERVRRAIAATPFRLPDGREIGVTVSIGVSCYPNCADTPQEVVERADQALYVAKEAGRNRVVLYREMLKKRDREGPVAHRGPAQRKPRQHPADGDGDLGQGGVLPRAHARRRAGRAPARAGAAAVRGRYRGAQPASRLHDIGMAVIPDAVLNKTTKLTEEEWAQVRRHPAVAAGWLEQVPALKHLAPIVRHHHERLDGSGYPDGLKGEATPYLARVLAVADAYASMIARLAGARGP